MPDARPFLTAEWRYLLMLNYEIDPEVLGPLIPAGTELDLWQGRALVSVVGFLFRRTRLLGLPVPFHTNFEEVNLRFYVCRPDPAPAARERVPTEPGSGAGEPRRGVTFVKEIVPRLWVAQLANLAYGEHYVAWPMGHTVEQKGGQMGPNGLVEYTWRCRGKLNRLGGLAVGDPLPLEPGSEAEFITQHFWGYTRLGASRTGEYRVEHPAWRVWSVAQPYLLCDVKSVYGDIFEPFLRRRPRSALLAEGSPIAVYPGGNFTVKTRKK